MSLTIIGWLATAPQQPTDRLGVRTVPRAAEGNKHKRQIHIEPDMVEHRELAARQSVARSRPEKKREPAAPAASKILPMELRVGDRLADETGEWEVIGRPYTITGGKYARVRVQMFGQPTSALKTWGAHEKVSVKRA